jgi:hypothetical protein
MKPMKPAKEILIGVIILVVILAGASVWSGNFSRQQTTNHTAILLPAATPGVHYDSSLQIANATIPKGQWQLVSTSGQLPPGLSVVHLEHGCVPTEPACLQNNFDLSGTPAQAGTYTFSVTFSMGGDLITQAYQVRVLP